ncbi:MAG TPA: glucose-6-phosphate dehydrogenase [Streptosporangiaceae bacterium]|jgi:glucose-6-phosphate 1-dehydrogenase|nr:glucose-6-phosphate dehydrogenase [Streptosporangiaceae bacterium]
MATPENHVIVLFGATGDLARRKLLPGLFHLAAAGLMPDKYQIIGSARRGLTDEQFRDRARDAITEFGSSKPEGAAWESFQRRLSFASAEPGQVDELTAAVLQAEQEIGGSPGRMFHLAVPPSAFVPTVQMLGDGGLALAGSRVIVEKPFGTDLASARALNQILTSVFDESQVFRIDHFLGKESVDNILAFRFANGLFEPVWNREHISYVQIDVPETLSIEGRADFYDQTGAYRDMVVTHLFQVLGFVAMEPPTSLEARHLREETAKVFDAVHAIDPALAVRGQYAGYTDEAGVAAGSTTETLAAVRAEISNWRWEGVPFLLRSGKSMAASRQVITLGFRRPPLAMFPISADHGGDGHNEIVIDFADPGSITARFLAKEPGAQMRLDGAEMRFSYANSFCADCGLEGYERLILDAMLGDQSLFTSAPAIERLWEVSAPLLDGPPAVQTYARGSWGPQPALDRLAAPYSWNLQGPGSRA